MLYSYVPSLVKCRVFGVELQGLSKDTLVTIERLDNIASFRKAQDGSNTAYMDKYGSYRITFHIEQVSESNEFLHTIFKLHERFGQNIKIPISVTEEMNTGGTQFLAFDSFFETEPSSEFTSVSGARQWVFVCHNASYSLKGTTQSSTLTQALRQTIRLIELSNAAGIDLSNIEEQIRAGVEFAEQELKKLF